MANTLNRVFGYNPSVVYKTGGVYKRQLAAVNLTTLMITVGPNEVFYIEVTDIWRKYRLPPVKTDTVAQAWNNTPMQFWQNQLNFAVWCATTGCGVSFEDHLNGAQNKPSISSTSTILLGGL